MHKHKTPENADLSVRNKNIGITEDVNPSVRNKNFGIAEDANPSVSNKNIGTAGDVHPPCNEIFNEEILDVENVDSCIKN